MIGWIGDFFRFWWALFYWNTRKGWFCLRGAHRDDCPCQNSSDSGLANDTRCDAIIHWDKPERFCRVCPLLVETPQGLRCSAEAESVRPFWGRAAAYVAALLVALYLAGTISAYVALKSAKYEVSYATLVWPPNWRQIRSAQEKLYSNRAQAAIAAGNFTDAILALEAVCRVNPRNYDAGVTLARLSQAAAQPTVSDHVYERLLVDVPARRIETAQTWFRNLLARGAYKEIIPLAASMLSEDPEQRAVWLHALLFSARQTHDARALSVVAQQNPHLPDWCTEIINTEQMLLQKRLNAAMLHLTQIPKRLPSPYFPFFQVDRLILEKQFDEANARLIAYAQTLTPHEAAFLRLRVMHEKKWDAMIDPEFARALDYPLNAANAAKFCAYLIAYPSASRSNAFYTKLSRHGPPLTAETLPLYDAAFVAATMSGDTTSAGLLRAQFRTLTASDGRSVEGLAELVAAKKPEARIARILPLVPLPTEVIYAILESPVFPARQ